jgi:RND family efflux transporter MFP subunit
MIHIAGCTNEAEEAGDATERFPVEVEDVSLSLTRPTLSYSGTIVPWRRASLGAQIAGRIERLHVDIGDRVTRGDLLVEMAGEQLTQAEAQFRTMEKDWERMKLLLEKGAVTQQRFDQTDAAYQAARARYEMVLESTRIRTPFSGVVTQRHLDEGEVFTLMPTAAGAPAIVEVSKIDTVKVGFEVAEQEWPRIRLGLAARVAVDGYPGREFLGTVRRLDPALDASSRTATAEVVVSNRDEALRPGMFADLELELREQDVILISRDAIIRQEGTGIFYVYVVGDGVARRREISVGRGYGDRIEVVDGLTEGEQVVTAGRYRLHEGAEIDVVVRGGER